MNLPIEFWIIASCLIGAAIGFVGAIVFLFVRRDRIERETWKMADLFHNHKRAQRL